MIKVIAASRLLITFFVLRSHVIGQHNTSGLLVLVERLRSDFDSAGGRRGYANHNG
jgi:hypothetical protein